MKELMQTADWKAEKHVPVIEAPETVNKGEKVKVTVSVGKEIAHPNTTEHHISWIELYFHPEGEKFPYLLGKFDFSAHGQGAQGPNTGGVYTAPEAQAVFTTEKAGKLHAMSYCNIHGLWVSEADLKVN